MFLSSIILREVLLISILALGLRNLVPEMMLMFMFQYVHMHFAPERERLVQALRPLLYDPES